MLRLFGILEILQKPLLNGHLDCAHLALGFPVLSALLKAQPTREPPAVSCLRNSRMLKEKAGLIRIQEVSATVTT